MTMLLLIAYILSDFPLVEFFTHITIREAPVA